jgi:hypothetical protein
MNQSRRQFTPEQKVQIVRRHLSGMEPVSKYQIETAPGGRAHRLVVVAHPLPQITDPQEPL